jgi:hypothetical protein
MNVPRYIGIDSNENLIYGYSGLSTFLKKHSQTEIELYFTDAVSHDYTKHVYDLLITSLPYYDLEKYGESPTERSKLEWERDFYTPLIRKTYDSLQNGGYYVLNVSERVYSFIKTLLGEPMMVLPFHKNSKPNPNSNSKYREYVYVWHKGESTVSL